MPIDIDKFITRSRLLFSLIPDESFETPPDEFNKDKRLGQIREYSDNLTAAVIGEVKPSESASKESQRSKYEEWLDAAEKAIAKSDHVTAQAIYRGLTEDQNGNQHPLSNVYTVRLTIINSAVSAEIHTLSNSVSNGQAVPMVPAFLTGHSKNKPYHSHEDYSTNLRQDFNSYPNFQSHIKAAQKAVLEEQYAQHKSREPKQNLFFLVLNSVINFFYYLKSQISKNQQSGIPESRAMGKTAESSTRSLVEEGMFSSTTTTLNTTSTVTTPGASSVPHSQHQLHSQGEIMGEINQDRIEQARKELYTKTKEKLNQEFTTAKQQLTEVRNIKYKIKPKFKDSMEKIQQRIKQLSAHQRTILTQLENCENDWKNWQRDKDPSNPSNMFSDENVLAHIKRTSKAEVTSAVTQSGSFKGPLSHQRPHQTLVGMKESSTQVGLKVGAQPKADETNISARQVEPPKSH